MTIDEAPRAMRGAALRRSRTAGVHPGRASSRTAVPLEPVRPVPPESPAFARASALGAFTLLELIIVVSILALIAGGVVLSLGDIQTSSQSQLGVTEMSAVREAILRFRADTGFFPKTGPFALAADGGAIDPTADGDWPGHVPSAQRQAWFDSPANLYQLFEPADATANVLLRAGCLDRITPLDAFGNRSLFNPETGRGYRGPYLTRSSEGFVRVGADLLANGDGDPTQGATLAAMPAVADPFTAPPGLGGLPRFQLSLADDDPGLTRFGRPYLVITASPSPRVVGFGPNGTYDSDATQRRDDDVVVLLEE